MPRASFRADITSWEGRHRSYTQAIEGLHDFAVHHPPASALLGAYNDVTAELQSIIARAIQNGKSLRAMGSSWSLSTVGVTDHELINTKNLRIGLTIPASHVSPGYGADHTQLRFLECGYSIAGVNGMLFDEGLSLKACGSNNGQTLVGGSPREPTALRSSSGHFRSSSWGHGTSGRAVVLRGRSIEGRRRGPRSPLGPSGYAVTEPASTPAPTP